MNPSECEIYRDLLPELAAGSLSPSDSEKLRIHLSSCTKCSEELGLLKTLRMSRPPVPQGLEDRIRARVREEFGEGTLEQSGGRKTTVVPISSRRRLVPTWALSAAAVVILALGIGVIGNNGELEVVQDPIVVASQDPLPEAWLWDDGMVAGAPVFDGISDEDLEALLEEFEGGV
jgi:hypothetical protein